MNIRKPAVAGAFYPGDPTILSQTIDDFFSGITVLRPQQRYTKIPQDTLRVLIVPHAGYIYSGPVAAYGFKEIKSQSFDASRKSGFGNPNMSDSLQSKESNSGNDSGHIKRVVILGNSHQFPFEEIAIDSSDFWETPLGRVELDRNFIENLISESPKIIENSQIHAAEHSLEIELPFLQKTLTDFKIVPILLGSKSEDTIDTLVSALTKYIDSKTLVLISTDLSHYPSYEDANRVDRKTIEAVVSGDTTKLDTAISESMSEGIPNLATCICGEAAVRVGMKVAAKLEASDIQLLKYANSGDTAGDKSRVVGYAAIGFYTKRPIEEKSRQGKESDSLQSKESDSEELPSFGEFGAVGLGEKEQIQLLEISRQTLEAFVRKGKIPKIEISNPNLNEPCGAFVTLRKPDQNPKTNDLRGCMGVFEPEDPLWKVVQDRTVAAAAKDPRFAPVRPDELSEIEIEISVLSKPKKIGDSKKIELGKHGVILKRGSRGGVFLPQVATETGWDLETFLGQLCSQKAGLPWDCWKDPQTELYTFTAQVFP